MKLIKLLDEKFEEYILITTLITTVCLIFLQVIMRYVFKNSLSWSEELARYIFIWQSWISTGYAVKKSKHIRVEVLNKHFHGTPRTILETGVLILWLAFCIYFGYEAILLTQSVFHLGQCSPAIHIPMGYVYAAVPVGCMLMSIRLIQELYAMYKAGGYHVGGEMESCK